MKKYLYIALAAAALTSCSSDDTLELNQEAISFGKAFVGNSTRATDPSYGSENKLTAFKVWGNVISTNNTAVGIFADDDVTGTVGENSVWNCTSKTQYWITDAKYHFAAVVNADEESGKSKVTLGADQLPATIEYTADGSKDLLYAKSIEYTGKATGNDLVKFDFAHLLSKVKFNLSNTIPTTNNSIAVAQYTYTLTDISITNAITQGTYTVNDTWDDTKKEYIYNGTWTSKAAAGQTFDAIEGVTNGTNKDCANEKLLIPLENAAVSCKVNLYYEGNLISSVTKTTTIAKLEPGCAYSVNVIASLNNTIQFTVTEDPSWTNADGGTITVQ